MHNKAPFKLFERWNGWHFECACCGIVGGPRQAHMVVPCAVEHLDSHSDEDLAAAGLVRYQMAKVR